MSFKLNFFTDRVIATFDNNVLKDEIKNAFIELIDNVSIKNIKYLIFDFSTINSYTIPTGYLETLKTITIFSSSWNTDIRVSIIATNPNIRTVVNSIIEKSEEFTWEFNLFQELQLGINWCEGKQIIEAT